MKPRRYNIGDVVLAQFSPKAETFMILAMEWVEGLSQWRYYGINDMRQYEDQLLLFRKGIYEPSN